MMQFLLLALALAQPAAASRGASLPDPPPGPRPVTDKDVLAWSPGQQCTDRTQEQRAMEERMKGLPEDCIIPPKKRNQDGLDQSQPHP
jgi:hypothetical protein